MEAIRLLIVDDHILVRDGLAAILQEQPNIAVVGYAQNGQDALDQVEKLNPEIVLMDIAMPVMDGLQATRILKERRPETRVLVLTMHDEPEYVRKIMQAGASGYVLKDVSSEELLRAILAVHQSGTYLSEAVSRHLFYETKPESVNVSLLTTRELDVLKLIAKGQGNKEIARQLEISVRTVESHRLNLRNKLGIPTAAGLARYAIEQDLI